MEKRLYLGEGKIPETGIKGGFLVLTNKRGVVCGGGRQTHASLDLRSPWRSNDDPDTRRRLARAHRSPDSPSSPWRHCYKPQAVSQSLVVLTSMTFISNQNLHLRLLTFFFFLLVSAKIKDKLSSFHPVQTVEIVELLQMRKATGPDGIWKKKHLSSLWIQCQSLLLGYCRSLTQFKDEIAFNFL